MNKEFISKFFNDFRNETLELERFVDENVVIKIQTTILRLEKLLKHFKSDYSDEMVKEIKGDLKIHSRW